MNNHEITKIENAAKTIQNLFRQFDNKNILVSFLTKEKLGLACDNHWRFSIQSGVKILQVPTGMALGQFSNATDAFSTLATLCYTYPMRTVTDGACVVDFEDASDQGDYSRIAFGASWAAASLVVDPYYVKSRGYADLTAQISASWLPWGRREAKVFWRGSTTGIAGRVPPAHSFNWKWLPRLNLCWVASQSLFADRLDIGITQLAQMDAHGWRVKNDIIQSGLMRSAVSRLDFMRYRYLVDIDGNANAWDGLFGAMLMGACILKVTSPHGWRQWYYDRLIPGVHFLPVRPDLSNFDEVVRWALDHESECAEMGRRARQFATSMFYKDELDLSGVKLAQLLTSS